MTFQPSPAAEELGKSLNRGTIPLCKKKLCAGLL